MPTDSVHGTFTHLYSCGQLLLGSRCNSPAPASRALTCTGYLGASGPSEWDADVPVSPSTCIVWQARHSAPFMVMQHLFRPEAADCLGQKLVQS